MGLRLAALAAIMAARSGATEGRHIGSLFLQKSPPHLGTNLPEQHQERTGSSRLPRVMAVGDTPQSEAEGSCAAAAAVPADFLAAGSHAESTAGVVPHRCVPAAPGAPFHQQSLAVGGGAIKEEIIHVTVPHSQKCNHTTTHLLGSQLQIAESNWMLLLSGRSLVPLVLVLRNTTLPGRRSLRDEREERNSLCQAPVVSSYGTEPQWSLAMAQSASSL